MNPCLRHTVSLDSFDLYLIARPSLSTMIVGVCPPKDILNVRNWGSRLVVEGARDVHATPVPVLLWVCSGCSEGVGRSILRKVGLS